MYVIGWLNSTGRGWRGWQDGSSRSMDIGFDPKFNIHSTTSCYLSVTLSTDALLVCASFLQLIYLWRMSSNRHPCPRPNLIRLHPSIWYCCRMPYTVRSTYIQYIQGQHHKPNPRWLFQRRLKNWWGKPTATIRSHSLTIQVAIWDLYARLRVFHASCAKCQCGMSLFPQSPRTDGR